MANDDLILEEFSIVSDCCPWCNVEIITASRLATNSDQFRAPRPGDISCCINCVGLIRFDESGKLQRADDSELLELRAPERKLIETYRDGLRLWKQMKKEKAQRAVNWPLN